MGVKQKAAVGGGIAAVVALAIYGLLNLFHGGGLGLGPGGGQGDGGAPGTSKGGGRSGDSGLVITVEGEKYLVDGNDRSLKEVTDAAEEVSKSQSSQSGTRVLVKQKETARYNTVKALEEEFKRRGIRYRTEKDY
jgi:hypothetical protein